MLDLSEIFQDTKHQSFFLEGNKKYCAILVHGFPGTPNEMRPIAEIFHSYGWTVHALLLPGFGIDVNSLADRTYTEWLSAVLNVINQHRLKYENIILVGLSMGGAISIQASVSSEIDHLLLLAPFWKIDNILWSMLPIIKWIIPSFKPFQLFKSALLDAETIQEIREWLPSADIEDIKQLSISTNMINQVRLAGNHARQSVAAINLPTTIIQGKQDDVVTCELTQTLVGQMTTEVNYLEIDGDHNLTDTEKPHWETVKALVHQFAIQVKANNS